MLNYIKIIILILKINMKFSIICLLGLTNAITRLSDKQNLQVGDYDAYMSGFMGYHTYVRDTPDRFETEEDDILMHSMYA